MSFIKKIVNSQSTAIHSFFLLGLPWMFIGLVEKDSSRASKMVMEREEEWWADRVLASRTLAGTLGVPGSAAGSCPGAQKLRGGLGFDCSLYRSVCWWSGLLETLQQSGAPLNQVPLQEVRCMDRMSSRRGHQQHLLARPIPATPTQCCQQDHGPL